MEILPYIHQLVEHQLDQMKLSLNEDKTRDDVDVYKDGLNFVGFHFDGVHIRAQEKNIEKFKKKVEQAIIKALAIAKENEKKERIIRRLIQRINSKIRGRSGVETCPWCGYPRKDYPRSWMAFFSVVTDINQLREIDKWIRKLLYDLAYKNFKFRLSRQFLEAVFFKKFSKHEIRN